MDDRGSEGVEVAREDLATALRMQSAARVAGHLLAALGAGLSWALGHFEEGSAAVVDGETAFDGEVELDLVTWTRGRILGVAETVVAEASAALLAEAKANPVAAMGRYIREDVRGLARGRPSRAVREADGGSVAIRREAAQAPPSREKTAKKASGWAGRIFLTTEQAAEFLGLSPRTLERWRVVGDGPAFHKLGRRVVYSRDDLGGWVARGRRRSTSDPGEAGR